MAHSGGQEIAIIGSGCRFPGGANDPSRLWDLLCQPRSLASELPALKGFYHENSQYHGHSNVREAYLLAEDAAERRFDAAFFGVKTAEAHVLDPQIRLLLETVYEALEAGGLTIDNLRGSDTAVYTGQMVNDYELLMYRDHEDLGQYHATGTSRGMLPNRVSYFFDWHGPSMNIDTACSSSLVALHHAAQQLRSGHSRIAVVAGCNLIYDVGTFIAMTNLQMLSPNGRSRMWDADANGYARGEGVAVVVLKTREAAEADGDDIECVIRETAINQDGKTPGPTMPSPTAQAQLIRNCYERAGLDLSNPAHRPQFFEAHGTGTQTGDPVEAEAISSAFFPNRKGESPNDIGSSECLLVGSVKTVIGHTEGTAGIAGVLKASLALQHGMVPPNLLFQRLNPRVKPFYDNLRIPTSLTPWPEVPGNGSRRASVNSFGFGGTNAHAIMESYRAPSELQQPCLAREKQVVFAPFVFSAASETSLRSYLAQFSSSLRDNGTDSALTDIVYTLYARRTRLPVVTTIAASTAAELRIKLEAKIEKSLTNSDHRVGIREIRQASDAEKPKILGVFTGQGAQWAQMGLDLITASSTAKSIIERLQDRLDKLPVADRPNWSLLEEMERDASTTLVMEAAYSQPICTVVQILQVELLRAANIQFTAVVGHSSGEIAAAYAADFISAEDAICIAYYRGLYSKLVQQKGAMMAVGTSSEDAEELLSFPEFSGRACVACINSATSITISGDLDAIEELRTVFEDEGKFVRMLKVDMAYHSHHMRACSDNYLASLTKLDMQVRGKGRGLWFSSVSGLAMDENDTLGASYWVENMVNPVKFMQAVDSACGSIGSFNMAIELGPHSALKGPTLQTMQDRVQSAVPYTGLFERGVPAITSIADGLGYAWAHLGNRAVSLQGYDQLMSGNVARRLVKGLPKYAWDHDNEYWYETRHAKAIRKRPGPVHELLGHLDPDSTEYDMRWRQILCLPEVQWLRGHKLQNIVVLPATGYIVTVLEAARMLSNGASVTLLELLDADFASALVFEDDKTKIEVILSITNISKTGEMIEANFKYHATSGRDTDVFKLRASGRIRIHLGQPCDTILPARPSERQNLRAVSEEKFYQSISELGYGYTGQFKALKGLKRKLGAATGYIAAEPTNLIIHPAALDAAFQSILLTYSAPGDGTPKAMHVPRRIKRVSVNPALCVPTGRTQTTLSFDSSHPLKLPHNNLLCDYDLYPSDSDHPMVQVQALEAVPFSRSSPKDDRALFSNILWEAAEPDAQTMSMDRSLTSDQYELVARVLYQVVHRYPHMNILEIGTQTRAATKAILQAIGRQFDSYTVASVAPTADAAQALLETHKDKILFKPSDILKDLRQQGFSEASYDLVVACYDIRTAPTVHDRTLTNLRRLLKPGGYLVAFSEGAFPNASQDLSSGASSRHLRSGGYEHSLIATFTEWELALRRTGFSGLDYSTPEQVAEMPSPVIVSQAMDEKVEFIREPLSHSPPHWSSSLIEDLVVVGSDASVRSGLITCLSSTLRPFCDSLRVAHSLLEFVQIDVAPNTVILNLTDLADSVFSTLDNHAWGALKKMMLHAGSLFWVTQGRTANNPYANMILGLLHTAVRDNPTLDYLLLDFDNAPQVDHHVIAEALLRHKAASQWQHQDGFRLTVENELKFDKEGRLLIPRLIMNQEMNDRYNANRREIQCERNPSAHDLVISTSTSRSVLEFAAPTRRPTGESTELRTLYSLLSPVRVSEFGFMFVALGHRASSGETAVVLSNRNNSLVRPHKELCIPVTVPSGSEALFLWLIFHHLVASSVLRGLLKDDRILVHEPSPEFAALMVEETRPLGVQPTFSTTDAHASGLQDPNWTFIHPVASEQAVWGLARAGFAVFLDMSSQPRIGSIGQRIASAAPRHCRKEDIDSLFGTESSDPSVFHLKEIRTRLERAVAWCSASLIKPIGSAWNRVPTPVSLEDLPRESNPVYIIDWTASSTVTVKVQPVDLLVSFPTDRTYWLVGLTGSLGLSLCEWMAQRGAQNFVISSRKPNVDSAWLDDMRTRGVNIKVAACDITEKDQVRALYSDFSATMPTIAGVAQGAMVLQDTSIQDMNLEQFFDATKPKVDGSVNLNELFQENILDFFIFFSSVSSVVGNNGQANYSAANTFMASLAEQRRQRGLAASVIDTGGVWGVGYVERALENSTLADAVMRMSAFVPTSERDFHQLFGEAVLAGRPGSSGDIELVSGLRMVNRQEESPPVWHAWPRMSHFVLGGDKIEDPGASGVQTQVPVKEQLANAVTSDEVYKLIWDAFTSQLNSLFQISIDFGQFSSAELGVLRFDQMGVDSLTAVEIRGWFVKTLGVNIPTLRILNGGTIGELVTMAAEELGPQLGVSSVHATEGHTGPVASAISQLMADKSSTDPDGVSSSFRDGSVQRPPPTAPASSVILKSVPVSFTQSRFYPSGLFLEDKVGLNHTAWARISGNIHASRLAQAVRALVRQHEILRTAFFEDEEGRRMQHILRSGLLDLEHRHIQDEEEVVKLVTFLQNNYVYNVASGETMRLVLLTRSGSETENFLIMGVHPLVIDATSLPTTLRWLAFHYDHPNSDRRVKQFADASEQRRAAYNLGKYDLELRYWREEFATPPPPLPLLMLTKVTERPSLKAYENSRGTRRVNANIKAQIIALCRRLGATPFHFYVAVLRALLLRYTVGGEDVTMAVAESGRGNDAEDMDVIGPLYNLVLVRLVSNSSIKFEDLLQYTRDKTLAGLTNSNFPYPVLVEELGLQRAAKYNPLFQVFVDYRMNQREKIPWAEGIELQGMGFALNVPYDVYLDIIDDDDGSCVHHMFLRKDMFGEDEADKLAADYLRLMQAVAVQPGVAVGDIDLSEPWEQA